jgi:methyl-accepting chemotaxis protein
MAKLKIGFFQSLRFRMIAYAVLPVTLILAGVVGYISVLLYDDKAADIEHDVLEQARKIALQIDRDNTQAVSVAKTMALSQRNGLFGRREESAAFARNVLEAFPEFTGAYFGYEPDADGHDVAWQTLALNVNTLKNLGDKPNPNNSFEKLYTDEKGRFLPYWHRDRLKGDSGKLFVEPLQDMEKNLETAPWQGMYYRRNKAMFMALGDKNKPQALVTEPYEYEGVFMVEQTFPIVVDNQFKGIAGVDRELSFLSGQLSGMKDDKTDILVISDMGRVIVSTNLEIPRATPISAIPEPFKTHVEYMHKQRESSEPRRVGYEKKLREGETEHKTVYMVSAMVPTGGWQVILLVDHDVVFQPVYGRIYRVLLIAGLGLLVIVMLLIWIADTLTRRIGLAVDTARRVALGDLSVKVQVTGRDEAAVLLDALRMMTDNLNLLVGQVKQASIKLTSTATELSATSREQEGAINSFGASTSQIAAAVKEISATGQDLVQTMADVNAVATNTAELAESGRSGLSGMDSTMRQLTQSTSTISSKLGAINDKAADITMVVTTITKVADQTNLLSVNAAIEAEKAGEYGLGFLVVAREIRRLADQTGVATLDIEQMVKEMQTAVSAGVMEMDKFSEQVRKGVDDVAGISAQLAQIIESVQTLTRRFDQVTEGMQSQSQGAHQINDAMLQLTSGARQTIGSLQEFNSATAGLREAISLLKQEIEKFKLNQS